MASTSTNLQMTLPDENDLVDVSVLSGNFEKIDEKCGEIGSPLTYAEIQSILNS